MRVLRLQLILACSLVLLPCVSLSVNLHADQSSAVSSTRQDELRQQLAKLKEEKEQAQLLARFAGREAFRVMPIDWSGYHRYLDLQARSEARVEELDQQCQAIEQELQADSPTK